MEKTFYERLITDVEEVKDPGVWKYVERLLKRSVVPELPDHQSYPTPSGWVPPHGELRLKFVQRSRF